MPDDAPTGRSRRRVLATTAAGATGLVAGCAGVLDDSGDESRPDGTARTGTAGTPQSQPTDADTAGSAQVGGPVADAPVPATDTDYAVMGRPDAPVTATLFGGWKCPYTRQYVRGPFRDVVREYVRPGDLAVRFRAVRFLRGEPHGADEPRANRVGQAVWHTAPERFWPYFAHVFAEQPPETERWATTERLIGFARDVGVENTAPLERAATGDRYQENLRRTMDRVADLGIEGIPRLRLGGEITAPTLDPEATREQLERVVG